jgi:hypothetical protein
MSSVKVRGAELDAVEDLLSALYRYSGDDVEFHADVLLDFAERVQRGNTIEFAARNTVTFWELI